MKLNPKLALIALVAVFLLAFVLSIHTLSYTGPTTFLQGSHPASGNHVVFVHYVFGSGNDTGTTYVYHTCFYNS
jgi:hypothetical protein